MNQIAHGRREPIEAPKRLWKPTREHQRRADDCMQTALAHLLYLRIEQVPRFDEEYNPGKNQNRLVRAWLESIGFELRVWCIPQSIRGRWIACGTAARGHAHAVVMCGDDLEFDPHPSRAGLTEIDEWWLIVPFDPALALQPQPRRAPAIELKPKEQTP